AYRRTVIDVQERAGEAPVSTDARLDRAARIGRADIEAQRCRYVAGALDGKGQGCSFHVIQRPRGRGRDTIPRESDAHRAGGAAALRSKRHDDSVDSPYITGHRDGAACA